MNAEEEGYLHGLAEATARVRAEYDKATEALDAATLQFAEFMTYSREAKQMIIDGSAAYAEIATPSSSLEQFTAHIMDSMGVVRFDAARRRLIDALTDPLYDIRIY